MQLLKDKSLIFDWDFSEDGKTKTIVIYRENPSGRETKLSDVFERIPHGHVIKSETGMGATYLELSTMRNSIIVEPIKFTASSKAKKHNALYVGSPTKLHRVVSDKMIQSYCNDKTIEHKKILVVADSLPRLMRLLGDIFKDYFLMIDEIDSFQMDSSFRGRMEDCLDIYKLFPKEQRALVSATQIAFSDPELKDEQQTSIMYDGVTERTMKLYFTYDIKAIGYELILEHLHNYPNDKIMVAYNSVSGCLLIADKLASENNLPKIDIKIMCSVNSKGLVNDYYYELESNILPAKVNFCTSSYFSGFDLDEGYHLISISGNKNMIHALSEHKLKQIAGRCRTKLLSESIIYDVVPAYRLHIKPSSLPELLEAANKEIDALKCIEKNYNSNELLKGNLDAIRKLIIQNTTKEGHHYVRTSHFPNEEHKISYLNIDAYLESARITRKLYYDSDSLNKVLRAQSHYVTWCDAMPDVTLDESNSIKLAKKEAVSKAIEAITHTPKELGLMLRSKDVTAIEKVIIRGYLNNLHYVDTEQLLSKLEEKASNRDLRELNNFLFAAFYESLADGELYKRIIKYQLPLGKEYTPSELLEKWNLIYIECGFHEVFKSKVRAVRITKLHFKTKKARDGAFTLVSENPLKINVVKHRPIHKTKEEFAQSLQEYST